MHFSLANANVEISGVKLTAIQIATLDGCCWFWWCSWFRWRCSFWWCDWLNQPGILRFWYFCCLRCFRWWLAHGWLIPGRCHGTWHIFEMNSNIINQMSKLLFSKQNSYTFYAVHSNLQNHQGTHMMMTKTELVMDIAWAWPS